MRGRDSGGRPHLSLYPCGYPCTFAVALVPHFVKNRWYLPRYQRTVSTYSAWLQVKGETLRGSLVKGLTCSAITPLGRACACAHSSRGRAVRSSSMLAARAMRYCASHKVQMNQGLPWAWLRSCVTW